MFQESLETWKGKAICQMKKKEREKGEGGKEGRREVEGEEGREDKPIKSTRNAIISPTGFQCDSIKK